MHLSEAGPYLRFSLESRAGLICLDRPAALNAINRQMALAITRQLQAWRDDDRVGHVVIASSAARAFCAGGDIREVHGHITENDKDAVTAFFRAEYMMDVTVAEFDKPVIALADGLVIGGGAGLAQACRHVVISEATRLAMPEAAIGLFPDAGASLFFGRCPRAIALYLGICGHFLGAADCLRLGLADAMVPASQMAPLQAALMRCETDQIESVIDGFRGDPGAAQLPEMRAVLEHIFDDSDLGEMQRRAVDLAQIKGDRVAAEIAQALTEKCPMTHHVYLRLLQEAEAITTLPDALALDFQLAIKMTARPDFSEGVRAVLIDRTNDADWQPARLADVSRAMVDDVFATTGLPVLR
jgi:enoyl-CoA hydratase